MINDSRRSAIDSRGASDENGIHADLPVVLLGDWDVGEVTGVQEAVDSIQVNGRIQKRSGTQYLRCSRK